jgi:hypothetical protein
MAPEHGNTGRQVWFGPLRAAALANAVLWVLSIIALIVVMQRSSSPKGIFVILAGGLATALMIMLAVQKQNRSGSGQP